MQRTGRRFVQYGYLGLVVGYFVYYPLYSGNFQYYFSGAWTHEENQLSTLFKPGFYLFDRPIPIPKLVALPLTLALCVALAYLFGTQLEKAYGNFLKRRDRPFSAQQGLHRIFSLFTFLAFNTFFIYGGRPEILRFPLPLQWLFNATIVLLSTLWLYRTWTRSAEKYQRESDVEKLRCQLKKLPLDFSQSLDGRSIDDLHPDEVYILAKTLPGATQHDRLQVYRGVLKDALESGNTNTASSLALFEQMRQHLNLSDDEHYTVLTELGIEDPNLLDPNQQRTREHQLRLESYREALSYLLMESIESGTPLQQALALKSRQIQSLKKAYRITAAEDEQLLGTMFQQNSDLRHKAEALLAQLQVHTSRYQTLSNSVPNPYASVFVLLRSTIAPHQKLFAAQLLSILEILGEDTEALELAKRTGILARNVLPDLLQDRAAKWGSRLSPEILQVLAPHWTFASDGTAIVPPSGWVETKIGGPMRSQVAMELLEDLLQDPKAIVQAASLYALHQLNAEQGRQQARRLLVSPNLDELVQETAETLLHPQPHFTTLEKLLQLFKTSPYEAVKPDTLVALVRVATAQHYSPGDVLCQLGVPRSQILILLQGKAQVQVVRHLQIQEMGTILPGQLIGKAGNLNRTQNFAKVVATEPTDALAIATPDFETLLQQHPQLAQTLLTANSEQLSVFSQQ